MTRGIVYSRKNLVVAVVALAASGAAYGVRAAGRMALRDSRASSTALESRLLRDIAAMSAFSEQRLVQLRGEVRRFKNQLGPREAWEQTRQAFGKRWAAEDEGVEDASNYSTRSATFVMASPTVADWPRILETLRQVEALPGVSVAEILVRSGGPKENRTLERVSLRVTVRSRH